MKKPFKRRNNIIKGGEVAIVNNRNYPYLSENLKRYKKEDIEKLIDNDNQIIERYKRKDINNENFWNKNSDIYKEWIEKRKGYKETQENTKIKTRSKENIAFRELIFNISKYFLDFIKDIGAGIIYLIILFIGGVVNFILLVITSKAGAIIVSGIFLILSIVFILYIFGVKINLPIIPQTANAGNSPGIQTSTGNVSPGISGEMPKYIKTETNYEKYLKQLLSFLGIDKLIIYLNNYKLKIAAYTGTEDLFSSTQRGILKTNEGRNNNISKFKNLNGYFNQGDDENTIYSILAPVDLEIKFEDINSDNLKDFNHLPESIKDTIKKNNQNIKFKWKLNEDKSRFIIDYDEDLYIPVNNIDYYIYDKDMKRKAYDINNYSEKEKIRYKYTDYDKII